MQADVYDSGGYVEYVLPMLGAVVERDCRRGVARRRGDTGGHLEIIGESEVPCKSLKPVEYDILLDLQNSSERGIDTGGLTVLLCGIGG